MENLTDEQLKNEIKNLEIIRLKDEWIEMMGMHKERLEFMKMPK